jgi:formamidopyrimidine-DNA glycosylase
VPELPEIETIRRGLAPLLSDRRIVGWTIRNPNLRWPVQLPAKLRGARISAVRRRAKYLIVEVADADGADRSTDNGESGALILHLGMSGSLRILPEGTAPGKHDHLDIALSGSVLLRLNDPRRFGSVHWQDNPVEDHWLLRKLGPEPLSADFSGAYLKIRARRRRVAVKNFIMDSQIVVGVGNIYANEALFLAGIRPTARAGRVTQLGYERLVSAIRRVLKGAIDMGGTTLRDFVNQNGNPGYFKQSLNVYGREGLPCVVCTTPLKGVRTGQRATVFCPKCQSAQSFNGRRC